MAQPPCREPGDAPGRRGRGRPRRTRRSRIGATSVPSGRRVRRRPTVGPGSRERDGAAAARVVSAARTAPSWLEDPGGRAPDREAVDLVARRSGAASRGSSARRSRRARRAGSGRRGGSRIRATSAGEATRTGRRSRDGDDRRDLEVADRDPEPVERADDADPGGVRGRAPTSSAASRSAVAARSASSGSALPPGKLTSPLWWPSRVARSVRTTRAIAVLVRVEQDEHAGRAPGRPRSAAAAAGAAARPADDDRASAPSAGAGSGSGSVASRSTDVVEPHRRRRPAS